MKNDLLNEKYKNVKKDIPKSISKSLQLLKNNYKEKSTSGVRFFLIDKKVDYSSNSALYAVDYMPVNFYKIWHPLMELLLKEQIRPVCRVLEFGCGPGTSTFGFVEFYKYLALDNPDKEFSIDFCLIEKEQGFIEILKDLWNVYKTEMPENLKITMHPRNKDLSEFLLSCSDCGKFDYIIESNLFNSNEAVDIKNVEMLTGVIATKLLNKHSSVIYIEPSSLKLTDMIKSIRKMMRECDMSIYSPCFCGQEYCEQFASAYVDVSGIMKSGRKKETHSYEYVIFRNDNLTKYDAFKNKLSLDEIGEHVGERINFKAFITSVNPHESEIHIKVCDGSFLQRKDVWLKVPTKFINEEIYDCLNYGRGCLANVKNAIVVSPTEIKCLISTSLEILR